MVLDEYFNKDSKGNELSQEQKDLLYAIELFKKSAKNLIDEIKTSSNVDERWLAIATTNLQLGCMSLNRAITNSGTF